MERIYTIPLRKEFQKAPSYKRASKARRALREFLVKHMKVKEVKIGKYLNEKIWERGPKNPPHKVNVKVTKDGDVAHAELVDAPIEKVKKTKKSTKKKDIKKKEVKTEEKEETKKEIKEEVPKAAELKEEKVKEGTKKKEVKKEKVPTAAELKAKKASKK